MRTAEIVLEYQNVIHHPPIAPEEAFRQACSNDETTIRYWEHIWLANMTANKARFGSFAEHSAISEWNKYQYGPAILAGSGPSLKHNAHELKNRGNIPLISCLHNFHFFEDLELAPEYYVTLDAGKVTIEEVTEGGKRAVDEYWEKTKDRTLIAFMGTDPELLAKWKGRILFYAAPIPSDSFNQKMDAIETFGVVLANGGNVLGACLSFSKAILGAYTSVFVGADFSFGYNKKFHPWDSKYDANQGQILRATDIYGIKVSTWPSYWNFKNYFDQLALTVPGVYINCTEGGLLGAYAEGNISAFRYMDLSHCLRNLNLNQSLKASFLNPSGPKMMLYQ